MAQRTVVPALVAACLSAAVGPMAHTAPAAPKGADRHPVSALVAHPRLLLSPDIVRRLQAKMAAGDPAVTSLLAEAERLARARVANYDRNAAPPDSIAYQYQGFGWLRAVTSLGLAYRLTGAKRYGQKVVELLRQVNATTAAGNLDPITTDSGYPSRSAAFAIALAFDWAYPELAAKDRAATVATLNQWFDWTVAHAYERDGPAAGNYFGGHLLGFGAIGFATAGDNARAEEIIGHARSMFDSVVAPAFATGGLSGGFPAEGYVYGTNHFQRILQYLTIAGTATGKMPPAAGDFAERIARNLLHALKPNRWQVPDEADYAGDTTGVLDVNLPIFLSHLLASAGGERAGIAAEVQHLVKHIGVPPVGPTVDRGNTDELLYWDPGRPDIDYSASEPLYLHSPGDEHLFMRSSWSDDAVWASFSGALGRMTGHEARTAAHFAVQRGSDYLLVYAGQWKGEDGLSGNPKQFETSSGYANTLFVDDGGEYLYNAERYLGGQSSFVETGPFPYAQSIDATWAKLDATPTYDRQPGQGDPAARTLRQFIRNFVYLRPGTFVVFDRIRMSKPGYNRHLRFHLARQGAPTVSGNLTTSVVGQSALHIRTLLPRTPSIKVAWNTVNGAKLSPRVEITSREPASDLDALNVLVAQDTRAPPPEADSLAVDGGAMVGVRVKARADDRERIVLFASAPTGAVPAAATVRYHVVPTGPGRHHIFDLQPRQPFQVSVSADPRAAQGQEITVAPAGPGVTLISSDTGALTFDLVAGQVRPVP